MKLDPTHERRRKPKRRRSWRQRRGSGKPSRSTGRREKRSQREGRVSLKGSEVVEGEASKRCWCGRRVRDLGGPPEQRIHANELAGKGHGGSGEEPNDPQARRTTAKACEKTWRRRPQGPSRSEPSRDPLRALKDPRNPREATRSQATGHLGGRRTAARESYRSSRLCRKVTQRSEEPHV